MKTRIFVIWILLLSAVTVHSQIEHRQYQKRGPHDKIEELKKLKLLEELDLDEETAVRLLSRRSEHKERMDSLMNLRDEFINKIDEALEDQDNTGSNDNYKEYVDKVIDIEEKLAGERIRFFSSLEEILTPKQTAELFLFEREFHQRIRELMMKRGRGNNMN